MDTARAQTVLKNKEVMPHFHKLAEEGTLFTQAYSTAPWTLPSHASMFTGKYTSDHETHAGSKFLNPSTPTLAECLRDDGYETVSFSNNVWISPEFGFDRGFNHFRTSMQLVKGGADLVSVAKNSDGLVEQAGSVLKKIFQRDGPQTLINGIYSKFFRDRYDSGARLTNWRIKRWIKNNKCKSTPFFMFVNYLEPHLEYDPPKEFKYRFAPEGFSQADLNAVNQDAWAYICNQVEMCEKDFEALRALYKAELNYLDYRLNNLFNFFEDQHLLDDTMIIITGDHGENIGDYGLMDHQYCLHDTLLNVPLVIQYDQQFPVGKECNELIELRDLFPTILRAANTEIPDEPLVSDNPIQKTVEKGGRNYIHAEYLTPQPSMEALSNRVGEVPRSVRKYDRALRARRGKEWKFIWGSDNSKKLYDVTSSQETDDISQENMGIVQREIEFLQGKFGELKYATADEHDLNISTQERLEDLGYI